MEQVKKLFSKIYQERNSMTDIKTYKDELQEANTKLSKNTQTRFIGYGLQKGRALGTLKNVSSNQIIEMPVAENLMIGFAIGLALKNYLPVVYIERMDFIMNAMDAIVNHLDKLNSKSDGEFSPAVLIRCIVGNKNKPLYTGITHIQDYSDGLSKMISFPVIQIKTSNSIQKIYTEAERNINNGISTILVEYKDLI